MQIVFTNSWQVRLALASIESNQKVTRPYPDILKSQNDFLFEGATAADCLSLVRNRWCAGLQQGIEAVQFLEKQKISFIKALEQIDAGKPFQPQIFKAVDSPYRNIVFQIAKNLHTTVLDQYKRILEKDPTGGCPCLSLMTVFEAELL